MNPLVQINPASPTGKQYWRSLDEIADSPEFSAWAEREFAGDAAEMLSGSSRRTLLKLMAAGFGLAGLTACRRPEEHILPHARGIEGYIHGRPLHYSTAVTISGAASGLVVKASDGRPTKVEGNPRHPYSLGATTPHLQAIVLNLYDPDRARQVERGGARSSWGEFAAWAHQQFDAAVLGSGAGLRVLAERSASPSLDAARADLLKKFPDARWVEYDSIRFDEPRLGAAMAFGQPLEAHYQYDKADVVVSLDADFLGLDSPTVQPVKQFSARRRIEDPQSKPNRLYVAESNYSITGTMADHRRRVRPSEAGALALKLAKAVGVQGSAVKSDDKFVAAAAADLAAHRGRSVVVAGPRQPAAVHAVVALINQVLGNDGQTVYYTKPVVDPADSLAAVKQLAADLAAGKVKTLVLLGGNPAYTLPADLNFAEAMKKASTVALLAEENETWAAAEWRLPEAHAFETWGDARALDGTASIQQPLIEPLYGGKSALELTAILAGSDVVKPYERVRRTWLAQWPAAEAETRWKAALHDGVISNTKLPPVEARADLAKALAAAEAAMPASTPGMDVAFYASSGPYDGRFANNAWMQEAPDPLTKLVWDNAALLSPATARRLVVSNGDLLALTYAGRSITVPAMILPGHADNAISLSLGYGRSHCGRVGRGVGHRAEGLRTSAAFHIAGGVDAKPGGGRYELVTTQEHHTLVEPITHTERKGIVVETDIDEYRRRPEAIKEEAPHETPVNMFPEWDYSRGYQWGMSIDLNACTGCNACLVACQAENNIPVVGKEQVKRGREMHWIRLDRYFTGDEADPAVVSQPMACVQCEKAPCESVCPVAATAHSPEGLNEMAYNRCVGTRYCSNNCPFKVRRFNFFNYHKETPETLKMAFNPDVTVRMRGVMEKCNYCVQRIEEARSAAKADGRRQIRDGEIRTACQQVCPADAIVFGNINDKSSRVAKLKAQPRDYAVLEELNIKPRTTYLARLRNPNPELA